MGPRKRKGESILVGLLASLATSTMPRGFSTIYRSTTNDFRYTHRSTDYCVGGPCALPLVGSCLGKTCGVLDGLTAPESERPLVRRIILFTGNKCNTWSFFLHQYEHKTVVIYWTE